VPELTDEHIEDLFEGLRTDAIHQIRPPGVAAARTTVRRRRTLTSVTAGFAVLAVAGSIAVGLHHSGGPATFTNQPDPGPKLNNAALNMRRDQAASAVNGKLKETPFTGATAGDGIYTGVHDVLSGRYTLRVACAGTGLITAIVKTGVVNAAGIFDEARAQEVLRSAAPCTAAADVQVMTFAVPTTGIASVTLEPDGTAKGRSGFAYRAELSQDDRDVVQAAAIARVAEAMKAALGNSKSVTGGSAFLDSDTGVEDVDPAPGSYMVHVGCTGTSSGTVAIEIRDVRGTDVDKPKAGTLLADFRVKCGPFAPIFETAFTMAGKGTLTMEMEPSQDAVGQVAVAYQLSRVDKQ
jgi:hypothetical protein